MLFVKLAVKCVYCLLDVSTVFTTSECTGCFINPGELASTKGDIMSSEWWISFAGLRNPNEDLKMCEISFSVPSNAKNSRLLYFR